MKQSFLRYNFAVFFLYLAIFFCFFYNYHLLYAEQLQLFQYTETYFQSLIAKPGGFSDFLGTFIMQFYIMNHVGGLLVTFGLFLLFLLQNQIRKTWVICTADIFLLIPPTSFALFFMDVNANPGGLLAVIIALLFVYGISRLKDDRLRYVVAIVCLPLLYAVTGGGMLVYSGLLVVGDLLRKKGNIVFITLLLLLSIVLPLWVRQYWIPLSWEDTWLGTAFYRGDLLPDQIWGILLLPILVPILSVLTKQFPSKLKWVATIGCCLTFCAIIQQKRNVNEEMIYKLDYLLKKQDWDSMLQLAEKSPQRNLIFVSYVNLALLNKGQLPDKLLHFSQRAEVNEFWTSAFLPMLLTGETYYYLDMQDASRAYFYMANTQSPLGQSPFMYQRLAELETVRGNSRSGLKYVKALKNTLFYRDWADKMEQAITSGYYPDAMQAKIDRYKESDTFLAKEMLYNVTCKHQKSPENANVRDLLLAKYILANDYKGFLHCVAGLPNGIGREFPRLYHEFLLMYAYILRDNTLVEQWKIPQDVRADFYKYIETNQSDRSPEVTKDKLREAYGRSYWFYVQYQNEF